MELRRKLPVGRTYQQVENHYLVEKGIADRLKTASREGRKLIYSSMYDELFQKVPDHPRLTQRSNEQLTWYENKNKLSLVKKYLNPGTLFLEFAPGDCRFAFEIAKYVKLIYAVDISDQIGEIYQLPENFKLILYDGYQLDGIEVNSIDLTFSDQFIEHLHPDDTRLHFELAYSLLKPGGKYIFRTPHAYTGPCDVSQYFSDIPQGFHLKEWTFRECGNLLKELHFSSFYGLWLARGIQIRMPNFYFRGCELILNFFPAKFKRLIAHYMLPSICIVATK